MAELPADQRTQTLLPGDLASPPGAATAPPPARSTEEEKYNALLGQRLGEYVVRRYIGSGGMGVVYEGEHLTIGRKVAIKLIREEQTTSPHARGLLTEARAASAIRHHGIIDIFGFGQQPGVGQYLVMEYLEGRPLNELLEGRDPMSLPEAFGLLCQVLDALSAAHAVGVIHRDLKPSNIFIVRESNGSEYVKVLDFGLAKRSATPEGTTPQTYSDVVVGTPQYMAPEQALCEEVGPRTDLYAVGVIAFELLTGRRPFIGRSHMEIVAQHLKTAPPAPSTLVSLPPEVDALVLRLLAKEPKQRPASASEVARELKALLQPRENLSLLSMPRSSRSVPVVKPPSDSAPPHAPTATLSPPTPEAIEQAQPPSLLRDARWKWGVVAVALVSMVVGLGVPLIHWPASQPPEASEPAPAVPAPAPAQPAAPPDETATPAPAPAVTSPPSEPQPAPAPAPKPLPTPHRYRGTLVVPVGNSTWSPTQPSNPAVTPALIPPAAPASTPERNALPSGEHELELRNPGLAPYRRTIVIPADDSLQHSADFTSGAEVPAP